jgi:predicted alpha/beta superfamily hydrolase
MIESNYRVNPKTRTLAGHSFGGLFTLFAMLNKPEMFKNYIACSPSVPYKDNHIFEIEESFAARHRKTLPVNLFLSMGELEEHLEDPMVSGMYRFANRLESRGYQRFVIHKRLFPGEDHCTVIAPSFQAGLNLALKI